MQFVSELGLVALGSRLRALSDRLYATADALYQQRSVGLQARWFPLLRLLHDRGPRSVGEIAEAIGQTHSAVSQLSDKLVREGWLRSISDRSDRRLRRLALSERAEAALREVKPVWRAIHETLEARCSAAGVDVLDVLSRFAAVLDEGLVEEIGTRATQLQREAVQIVPFAPELREHFYTLNAEWLRRYFYIEEIDHEVLSNPESSILADGGVVLFAKLDDAVIGTCALKHEGEGVYELTKMAVDERHQGLGVGRRLIEAAIAEFRQRAGRTLFLETNSRLPPAIRLYESVGFEHQPTRKPDSHYQRSDTYMVWRPPQVAASRSRRRAPPDAPADGSRDATRSAAKRRHRAA